MTDAAARRASGELAQAIEESLEGMRRFLPASHPETAFFTHWLAKALSQQAVAAAGEQEVLRRRARREATVAAESLAIAYGRDHPSAIAWAAWRPER